MRKTWFVKIAFFGILAVAAAGALVMWLWNWLIIDLFHGPAITYIQALGLMLLSRILFRGFWGPRHHCHGEGRWMMKRKWEGMTPEEKEKMRELWKKRCGGYKYCDDTPPTPPPAKES
ncbi:MAG: hypothetical protein U0X76_02355 [Bacteroidia bacterium]